MTSRLPLFGRISWLALALGACLFGGCDGGLPTYNQLAGFRVLALRASLPSLSEGETTTLEALTFVEGEATPSLRYHWSWCPARLPSAEGGDCALDEEGLARLLGIDRGEIDFQLGDEATAKLVYPGRAEMYQAACENAAAGDAEGAFVFSCERGFPLSVRADIAFGEQTIRIQKEVRLLFGDLSANANPMLGGLAVREASGVATPAAWPEDLTVPLALGQSYEVLVEVDESSAEPFVPPPTVVDPAPTERPESLYISWFVSSGSTKEERTSFVENGLTLAAFGKNEWSLPKAGDEPHDTARLFLVLRDQRGGVSWLSRNVELAR